jgi:DNA repair protein RadD
MPVLHESRWYQQEAVQSLFDYFAANPGYDTVGKPVKRNPLICMPTGTGKSHVIADFVKIAMQTYPTTRVFMATHVKELIKQNANKLQEAWPLAPLGVYSAGLKSRETMHPIIFGGIQSAVGKFPLFGRRDLLIIDEAHLLSPTSDTSYQKFIGELTGTAKGIPTNSPNINPYLKVIGLTATRYRMGLGCLTNGNIFTDVAYDICTIDGFNRLIAEGFLAPLIPKRTDTQLDTSNVKLQNGEFAAGQLQAAVDKEDITFAALKETVNLGWNRHSWLIFASGVEHAEHISSMLASAFGIPNVCIHSKKTDAENAEALKLWKTGKVRAAVNMNALTTGVDHPACDLIGMLRPTMSTGLWVQMLGRGTRPYSYLTTSDPMLRLAFPYVKENCLVLDFAGNTRRLGPINDPVIPRPKGKGPPGDAPVRICPACGVYNHASARNCIACGTEFTFEEKIGRYADNRELIRSDLPEIETFEVDRVIVTPHVGRQSKANSFKVSYFCKGAIPRTFYEYKSVETPTKMWRHTSRDWFRQRYLYPNGTNDFDDMWDGDVPKFNSTVIEMSKNGQLRQPKSIRVWLNHNPPEIMGYEF